MNKKEIKEILLRAEEFRNNGDEKNASSLIDSLIKSLFSDKKYEEITKIFIEEDKKRDFICNLDLYCFETAYSFSEVNNIDKAENIYEMILESEKNNSAMLNNLAIIKEKKNKTKEAFRLIEKAKSIINKQKVKDEVIERNFERLSKTMAEINKIEVIFSEAIEKIKNENDFVLSKLNNFLGNAFKDRDFKNGKIAIPRWKFAVMMATDKEKAEKLREQWVQKGYVRDAGERDENNVTIYEINPHIEKIIKKIKGRKINKNWLECLDSINAQELDKISYFQLKERVDKVNKKYKKILSRDFDELVFNYLAKNEKSVIILSGSFVETLLIYYCEKKKIKIINIIDDHGKIKKIRLYECDLGILLTYFKQNKTMSDLFIHLGNISRIYRNFIHPGKELRNEEKMSQSSSHLCFISAMEISKKILK